MDVPKLIGEVKRLRAVAEAIGRAFQASHDHDEDDGESQEAWRAAWLAYKAWVVA